MVYGRQCTRAHRLFTREIPTGRRSQKKVELPLSNGDVWRSNNNYKNAIYTFQASTSLMICLCFAAEWFHNDCVGRADEHVARAYTIANRRLIAFRAAAAAVAATDRIASVVTLFAFHFVILARLVSTSVNLLVTPLFTSRIWKSER